MENKEQILEEQIKALKELIAIKDQVIQALRAQQPLTIPWYPQPSYPQYPQYAPYIGGPTSGTLTLKDGEVGGTIVTSGYASHSVTTTTGNVTNIKERF